MRIFDCFLYGGEPLDLLRIRLAELGMLNNDYRQVIHVLVEADYTFTGKPKPIQFHKHNDEFPDILYWCNTGLIEGSTWERESAQRNSIKNAIALTYSPSDDDIVIISDYDEIPAAYAVQHYKPGFGLVALQMDLYYYYLNVLAQRQIWRSTRIMPWSYLKDKEPDSIRRAGFDLCLMNAGWHFSYTGGVDTMLRKFESFSHQEESVQKLASSDVLNEKITKLESLWGNDRLQVVPLDDSMPWYVRSHQEELKHLIYNGTNT